MKHLQLRITANWEYFNYGLSQMAIGAVMKIEKRRQGFC